MLTGLVVGDAACVDADAAAALELFTPDAVAATNNMIIRWTGRLDYACSLHISACENWVGLAGARRERQLQGKNTPETWSHKRGPGVDMDTPDWAGSTGLFAVKVLLGEGFDRIVLAGVPMSRDLPHFYSQQPWHAATNYHRGWKHRLPELQDKVRSMSGWTQQLLGAPSAQWLAGPI